MAGGAPEVEFAGAWRTGCHTCGRMRRVAASTSTGTAFARIVTAALLIGACSRGQDEPRSADDNATSAETTAATAPVTSPVSTTGTTTTPSTTHGEPTAADVALLPPAPSTLTPGEPMRMSLGTHCGVRILTRTINETVWRAREGAGTIDWVPAEWAPGEMFPDGPIEIQVVLSADGQTITGSLNGREVVYHADGPEFREEDLCD